MTAAAFRLAPASRLGKAGAGKAVIDFARRR